MNTGVTIQLSKRIKEEFGNKKDIWSWTGYTWEELMTGTEDKQTLLSYLDVVVDGRFELEKKDRSTDSLSLPLSLRMISKRV